MSFPMSRQQIASLDQEEDTLQYIIKPYVINPYIERDVPRKRERACSFHIPHEGKCWNCKKRKDSLQECDICQCIRYCSKECQESDWSRHRNICRKASFYDLSKCAIIITKDVTLKEEQAPATRTAYKLIDKERIHPNRILFDIRSTAGQYIELCHEFFDLKSLDLLPFLERRLSPQRVIQKESSYIDFNEDNAQLLLEYGGEDLYFSRHYKLPVLRFLINKGYDPDEIVDNFYFLDESALLFLASVGCTFTQVDERKIPLRFSIGNRPYYDKIRKIEQSRMEIIVSELSEHLILVLANIVIEYVGIPPEKSKALPYLRIDAVPEYYDKL